MQRAVTLAQFNRTNERAAALSLVAGMVHAIAMFQYMPSWWGYGIFFIAAAVAQVAYGIILFMKPWCYDDTGGLRDPWTGNARTVYLAGLIPTVGFIILYIITHTLGIPLVGPMQGQVEPASPLGILAQVVHLVLAIHLWILTRLSSSPAGQIRPA